MHELGIMTGVLDAVQTSAKQAGADRVLKVSLSVGEMTEAIEDALRFASTCCAPSAAASPRSSSPAASCRSTR